MAQPCKVCTNADRIEIDKALIDGKRTITDISECWHVPYMSVKRHRDNGHLVIQVAEVVEDGKSLDYDKLFDRLGVELNNLKMYMRTDKRKRVHYYHLYHTYIRTLMSSWVEVKRLSMGGKASDVQTLMAERRRMAEIIREHAPELLDRFTGMGGEGRAEKGVAMAGGAPCSDTRPPANSITHAEESLVSVPTQNPALGDDSWGVVGSEGGGGHSGTGGSHPGDSGGNGKPL